MKTTTSGVSKWLRAVSGLVTAALICSLANIAQAKVLAECGAFSGYSYYIPGPFVGGKLSGWTEDTISTGSTSIVEVGGEFDVIYSDATTKNRSSRADGAQVVPVGSNSEDGGLVLVVGYSGKVAEVYYLNTAKRLLILHQVKFGTLLKKSSQMISKCRVFPP